VAVATESFGAESFGQPCTRVTIIAVPGSNETNVSFSQKYALWACFNILPTLCRPRQRAHNRGAHYIAYPSSLSDYNGIRAYGHIETWKALAEYAARLREYEFRACRLFTGHIFADLTAAMGGGESPVPISRILGIFLLAGPALDGHFAPLFGMDREIGGALGACSNFGQLADRVYEICREDDIV
jgi:hypothetical protein